LLLILSLINADPMKQSYWIWVRYIK